MKLKAKLILAKIFFLFLFFVIGAFPALAQSEFDVSGRIVYTIEPRGNANVKQELELTNNFSTIYPKEYQLEIVGNEIKNIQAEDGQGSILNNVQQEGDKSIINLTFNEINVGKGKKTNFTINYDLPSLANKRGQVWETAIPRLAGSKQFNQLELSIRVPTSFGSLAYSSVDPVSKEVIDNKLNLGYNQKQIGENQILLAFGDFQIFDFDLDFSLTNASNQTVLKTIPIPPDTSYQRVFLTDIQPQPIKIYADDDYNWLALYEVEPNQEITINATGQAKIFANPENTEYSKLYEKKSLQSYLEPDQYWEVNSPIIQDLKNYFSTPNQIYDYVVEHLDYDYENLKQSERLGAVKAFQDKKGVCTEFSDLFVTLARSNGIPARELEGFAFTENKELFTLAAENDVLHSWVEYWDTKNKIWIPADPTWSKTTEGIDFINGFDLGHFAFVIHGQSSTKPTPPGFYKTNRNQNKNVRVNFADKLIPRPEPNLNPELVTNQENLIIKIKNTSYVPVYNTEIKFLGWKNKNETENTIPILPPLGEQSFTIKEPSLWQRLFSKPTYKLEINQKTYYFDYPYKKLNFIEFFANLWRGWKK